jgi:myo-inositol-1(or 4)-monophosphatase
VVAVSCPDYNIIFSDGQKIVRSKNAEYSFVIFPIDGMDNFTRSSPDFTVAVALEHLNENGQTESISVAISKIIGGELYYCEKGFGAYANNRRLRVSKRTGSNLIAASEDQNFLSENNLSLRSYGCRTLEVAYVSSARLEKAIFKNQNYELLKPFLLLVREAGGRVEEGEGFVAVMA